MNDSWLFDDNFNGMLDEFDDVIKYLDLSLEDAEANNLGGEDWNANFQSLEPPPFSVLSDLSEHNRAPQLKQQQSSVNASSNASSIGSTYHCNNTNDVKDSRLFQTSSPVSVLESSSSCSAENLISNNSKLGFPEAVKRTRSKRQRPSTLKLLFFISSASSASEEYHPSTSSESGSETYLTEQPARKKQKRKKNLTMLSGTREIKKAHSQQSVAIRKCMHCEVTETPQWREGPMGPKTLCNACGVRYRSGRLLPEYRPAASPTFVPLLHSNSHKKVMEMRNKTRQ